VNTIGFVLKITGIQREPVKTSFALEIVVGTNRVPVNLSAAGVLATGGGATRIVPGRGRSLPRYYLGGEAMRNQHNGNEHDQGTFSCRESSRAELTAQSPPPSFYRHF